MKAKICVFLIGVMMSATATASVLSVNSDIGGGAMYLQITDALVAAASGDTIYVSSSTNPYTDCLINKSITIVGTGLHGQSQNLGNCSINNLYISTGVHHVLVSGIYIKTLLELKDSSHHIVVESSTIALMQFRNNVTNCLFKGTIFTGTTNVCVSAQSGCSGGFAYPGLANLQFENCIFNRGICYLQAVNSKFSHCLFYNLITGGYGGIFTNNQCNTPKPAKYLTLLNNIIYNTNPLLNIDTTTCVFQNNITFNSTGTIYPSLPGVGNLNNVDPQFISFSPPAAYDFLHNYNLLSSSAGYNAATDGTDIGISGGTSPFNKYGESYGIPVIRSMEVENTMVPGGSTINVKVRSTKAR